jgi:hypothetical protein
MLRQLMTNIETVAPERRSADTTFWSTKSWWLFCLLVFLIKFVLLWLDPAPKLFMGDSGSYIWTALTGWIPPDRSYFYGYMVRWLGVWPRSFTPLLLVQTVASGATAIVFAIICRRFFEMPRTLSYFFGVLCALDPCQVVWERYVMTETFSLFLYVLVLYGSFMYLQDRRIWQLALVQALSVVLIGFRMSYLLVVQTCVVLLPAIAFGGPALLALRNRLDSRLNTLTTAGGHLFASVAIMLVMHSTYKHVNGWLRNREPAYLHASGLHLASVWAPVLQSSDAMDPRFRELIAEGHKFKLNSLRLRNAQHFADGFLADRWKKIERNRRKRDRIAKQTAMNALRRRPLEILGLAGKTYLGYWQIQAIQRYARSDLGYANLTEDQVKRLAEKFRFTTVKEITSQPLSFLQLYFVRAWPYYFVVLLTPLICALAIWVGRRRSFALLLFTHASILILVVTALSPQPCIRYLQPLSILALLSIAICIDRVARRGPIAPAQATS